MATPITLKSPLPAADLFFESMHVSAGFSMLGEMQLDLLSEKPDLKPADLLGHPLTVSLHLADGAQRHFNGYVTRFGLSARQGRYHTYQATVRPWLWFLTRTTDCRIFQEMSVPDIVKKVFGDHSIANFEAKLFRDYAKRVYCVQYRESDYNFVARLLEQEGIYWYFKHSDGQHQLVLVDAQSAHDMAPGCDKLRYIEDASSVQPEQQYVSQWHFSQGVETGKVALTSYDFERPSTSLLVDCSKAQSHKLGDYEQFDFESCSYVQSSDGKQYAENRADAEQTDFEQQAASSNAMCLQVGHHLKLTRHPRDDQNREYLVTHLDVSAQLGIYQAKASGAHFECRFRSIPATQQFRPPRVTPKPFVQGPQTAMVVGPSGDEIHTDKYGRVKLQFHWDRYGKKDDKSSCWVRVSHPWAGKNFGGMQIPRIGQEVVVDFLEGDPDQPLITGRVYNAEQMPPWDLPANATQSGILSRSSKGGAYGNANAIRFEDKKGSEQLWLHAEKNQDIEVENDETHWVGHDRKKNIDHDETTTVKHDRTETVLNNETITIGVNRTETVGANETITIGANRSITVAASETATVALQRTHAVGVNETIAIGAAQEIAIGAGQVVAVGAAQSISVGANQSTNVGSNQSFSVSSNQSTDVGENRSVSVGGDQSTQIGKSRNTQVANDDTLKVGKNLVIDAGDSVTIKTGSASITMKKDGTITIKGKDITIDGSGKINVKAGGDIVMKGSKILQN